MTPLERLVAIRRIIREICVEERRLVREVAVGCTHPEGHQVLIPWEHDNGYGRQTMFCGYRCDICNHYKHTYESYART